MMEVAGTACCERLCCPKIPPRTPPTELQHGIPCMPQRIHPRRLTCTLFLLAFHMGTVRGDEAFQQIEPLLRQHCYDCHGNEEPEAELSIKRLNPDFVRGTDNERWLRISERLELGDMPPEDEPPLRQADRDRILDWIVQQRRRAERAKPQPPAFRRLTRREYELTMQELLGLPIEFGARLPEDGKSKDGFRNDGDVLRISPLQYETFLQIADEALSKAIVTGPPPVVHRYRITPHEFRIESLPMPPERTGESFDYESQPFEIINIGTIPRRRPGSRKRSKEPRSPYTPDILSPSEIVRFREAAIREPQVCIALRMHEAFRDGETLVKVRVARVEAEAGADDSRVPILTVAIGSTNFHGVELETIGEPVVVDHTEFRTYEFRCRMENVSVPNVGPLNRRNATLLAAWNSALVIDEEPSPPLLKVEWIEFENPFFEVWPPRSHTDILFANEGQDEPTYAREVLRRFATRAFRGPIEPDKLERLVEYWATSRGSADSSEESLRETLSAVLASPRFLGLPVNRASDSAEKLSDHELASRLSYFLWSTMPDEELLQLAAAGKLRDPEQLATQVRRMIQDSKAWAFVEQFSEQWLELDRLQRVVVDKDDYPGFGHRLAAAMRNETVHFFAEVLRSDLSIFEFLDSDFTCVNDVLATHYGIPGVHDSTFRKVKLEPSMHRGGILTHASILTGLSDGKDGHPIKRGVWLLRNLLDDPPPPPPPNVPDLDREEPSFKGLTIPQALALHRDDKSCESCHRKIDPWGIAFEEYDAVGNWQRDGRGATLRKQRTQLPVASETELPGGVKVNGLKELQDELVRSKAEDFRRAMASKLMAYALGRKLSLSDMDAVDALMPSLRERGDRLPTLVELIVASELFQSK